jgi:hypothetical protein
MEQNELITVIATVLIVGIIIPMTLWYLGLRYNRPQFKSFGVAVAVFCFAVLALELGHGWFGWFEEDTFRTGLVGPAQRATESSITRETPYYVKHADRRHVVELLPVARLGEQAVGALTLRYEVSSPSGRILAQGKETAHPATGDKWAAIHMEFPTNGEGGHTLVVEIPKPAGEVKVTIREVRR